MSVELSDLLEHAISSRIDGIWKSAVGKVVAFDPVRQVCSVQLLVKVVPKGSLVPVAVPVLSDLPILYPGGGGFSVVFPLYPGDEVLVVFGAPVTAWAMTGSADTLPASPARNSLTDAVVIPGPRSLAKARAVAASVVSGVAMAKDDGTVGVFVDNVVQLGDQTATDPVVVMNSTLVAMLTAIDTQLKAGTVLIPAMVGLDLFKPFLGMLTATKVKAR